MNQAQRRVMDQTQRREVEKLIRDLREREFWGSYEFKLDYDEGVYRVERFLREYPR